MATAKSTVKTTKTKPTADKKAVTQTSPKKEARTASGFSIPVFSLAGQEVESLSLPKEIFGKKVNSSLLAQAVRIYLNNKKGHWSHTKTRGEVQGSTRKIFKQKGTGRARHGSIMAPIFVGGGIALGPKSRKTLLDFPKKMKSQALISALSQKTEQKSVLAVSDLSKSSGKTKEMVNLYQKLTEKLNPDKKNSSMLIVVGDNSEKALRAVQNLQGIDLMKADQINAYEVIKHQTLVLTKDAVEKLEQRLSKKEKGVKKDAK